MSGKFVKGAWIEDDDIMDIHTRKIETQNVIPSGTVNIVELQELLDDPVTQQLKDNVLQSIEQPTTIFQSVDPAVTINQTHDSFELNFNISIYLIIITFIIIVAIGLAIFFM